METPEAKKPRPDWLGRLLDQPLLVWILLGFLASYLLFFLRPVFLNPKGVMYFPDYVRANGRIGSDLAINLGYARTWLVKHQNPYVGVNLNAEDFHPPLGTLLFSSLIFLPFRYAYLIVTLLTMVGYGVSTLWFARWASGTRRLTPTLLLLAVTGFLSYGFQFQLERGQFDVIAMTLGLAAIAVFYGRPRLRPLSYVLLTLAIQLKVWPAILIVAFVADWRNWRREGLRILGILILNAACLFVLGPRIFLDFFQSISQHVLVPFHSAVNHSAASFAMELFPSHPGPLELAIWALVAACLLYAIWGARAGRLPGLNPYLLLVCTIAALVVPTISDDYTLPILIAPAAIFFSCLQIPQKGQMRAGLGIVLIFLASLAYSSLLFSFTNRMSLPLLASRVSPFFTENGLPAILVLLLAATALVALGCGGSGEINPRATPASPPDSSQADGQ